MGRHAAGLGLLRGFVEHAGISPMVGYGASGDAAAFEAAVLRCGETAPVLWSTALAAEPLESVGTLHLAGPDLARAAWLRRERDQRAYSLTGITHTTATAGVMESITGMLAAPVQSWDALICTSHSVRAMVEVLHDDQAEYLRARFGSGLLVTRPHLPVIPLGVHTGDFDLRPAERLRLRAELGVAEDDVLVLMAGRLSYHAKAHPHPMYLALQQAAEATGSRPHLLLASWFANAGQEQVFREGAAALSPGVTLHVVDGREPGTWDAIWSAADVYTLLSDNIQESFGLAPVEAMAAGLPVVGADWDGLRETVQRGVTGFLAPTLIPPSGAGSLLAREYAAETISYDRYIGAVAQSTAVDIAAAARGYAALLGDADLRGRMGEAGRERAKRLFDWSVVIPQYQALWAELASRRRNDALAAERGAAAPGDPAHSDPYRHFAAHASAVLKHADRIEPASGLAAAAAELAARQGAAVHGRALLSGSALRRFADRLAAGGPVGPMLDGAEPERAARTLLWLIKHGLVRVAPKRRAQ